MVAMPSAALLELITASTILSVVIYGLTIVLYPAVRRRLDHKKGAFDLGHFELPVAIGALAWSVVALFVLVAPTGGGHPRPGRGRIARLRAGCSFSACWCSTARRWRPSPET